MDGARKIDTVVDIEAMLATGRYSSVELLEGIRVAADAGRADLVERQGTLILEGLSKGRQQIPTLVQAAQAVAASYVARVSRLDDLGDALEGAERIFEEIDRRMGSLDDGVRAVILERRSWLAETRLLLADTDPISYVKLCSRLREMSKPELGVQAATRALEQKPRNSIALTTRAAAYLDLGEHARAMTDCRAAWEKDKNQYTAAVFSRACRAQGALAEALDIAEWGFRNNANVVSAHALVAAAAAAGDQEAAAPAHAWLAEHGGVLDEDTTDGWIELLAAQRLIDADEPEEAVAVCRQLLQDPSISNRMRSEAQKVLKAAKRAAKSRDQPTLDG